MSGDFELKAVYDLLRRMPPERVESDVKSIIEIRPDLEDALYSTVDLPLDIGTDETTGQQFIKCDYNRDLDSHRSPFSNEYFPPLEDGQAIPERLRNMRFVRTEHSTAIAGSTSRLVSPLSIFGRLNLKSLDLVFSSKTMLTVT